MNSLPDIWRTEVWHALSVHFPIVLLSLSSILFLIILPFIKKEKRQWSLMATVLLIAGTLTAWIAIYTGERADGIVSREICDPTVLKNHQNAAYIVAYLFTAAALLETAILTVFPDKLKTAGKLLSRLALLAGLGYVAYTGHLGASLVYQQGAGVYQPSENCAEFE